jgi:Tol biopolymer transport system component
MRKGEPRSRTRRVASIATLVATALALTVAPQGASGTGDTTLVSRSSGGAIGNGRSEIQTNTVSAHGAVSTDGRYVAFQSSADNLVPSDTNQATDVFVHDRLTGATERVSVGTGDVQTTDFFSSRDPSISGDGRYVAFTSDAPNLVAEFDQVADVFVHDRLTATTYHVCCAGNPNPAGMPAISPDGRYVAFQTPAALFAADTALGSTDIYVWDRTTGTVVDWASPGTTAAQVSINASISADGRYVAFESSSALIPADTNGTRDVYMRDRQVGTTELVSVDDSGGPADNVSEWPAISADGRHIAFQSRANDLVAPDTVFTYEVYVRDHVAGTTERISVTNSGAQVSGDASRPAISGDGRLVAFDTGAKLVDSDNNAVQDVYVRDRGAGTTLQASVRSDGSNPGPHGTEPSALAADGSIVAFDTANALIAGDTNGDFDVYAHELPPPPAPPNEPPSVDAGLDASVSEGGTFSSSGSFNDPDSSSWSATVDYGDGSGAEPLALSGSSFSLQHAYDDDGSYTVTVTVTDDKGAAGADTALVTVSNVAPTAAFTAESPIAEGGTSMLSLSDPSDPSAADAAAGFHYSFACDGLAASLAASYAAADVSASASCSFPDDGSYPVKGRILDKNDGASTYDAMVVVDNLAPVVGAISAPSDPVAVNTTVDASAPFSDPGVLDTHTGMFDWGDGTSSAGTVTEASGSGSASGSHIYTVPGVYTITLTVADDDGGSAQSSYSFAVVYDPNGPGVRGRGTILSPPGAYTADSSLTGEAIFGFQSRYKPGATTPDGRTRFKFQLAHLTFVSSSYDWLVVAGARAQFKGMGEINGAGSYGFLLTAIDGDVSGGGGADKFRIKIWDKATGDIVYDNKMGEADGADPQTIADGSIVIR